MSILQVPFYLPPEMLLQHFQRVPHMKGRFLSYVLPSDFVPLEVAFLLSDVAHSEAGDFSQQMLQERLSSIFLSHLMSSPRARPSWALGLTRQPEDLKIAPIGDIYSVIGLGREEVVALSWLELSRRQISNLKAKCNDAASPFAGARSLLDYSEVFGPHLKCIMTERCNPVSLQKLKPHPQVLKCQVVPIEQTVVVRLQGQNLSTICHVSLEFESSTETYNTTVPAEQFLSPGTWNTEHGFLGTSNQASHGDLILQWAAPLDAGALVRVKLEGLLSDLQEFSLTASVVDVAARSDSKRWSGELDLLQLEDPSRSSTSRSSHAGAGDQQLHESFASWRAEIVHTNAEAEQKSLRSDSVRSDASATKKKKLSALEIENKKLKKQLEEQTAANNELLKQLTGEPPKNVPNVGGRGWSKRLVFGAQEPVKTRP